MSSEQFPNSAGQSCTTFLRRRDQLVHESGRKSPEGNCSAASRPSLAEAAGEISAAYVLETDLI